MAAAQPVIHDDGAVSFSLIAPHAKEVKLQGDFLPSRQAMTMNLGEDGRWSITTGPLKADYYRYSFLVDGLTVNDPGNPAWVRFGDVYQNSFTVSLGEVDKGWICSTQNVPHGTVSKVWYNSSLLAMTRRMNVYTPSGYDPKDTETRYPVLYLLHGAGNDEESWEDLGRAVEILDNMTALGLCKKMIVVMPNGILESDEHPDTVTAPTIEDCFPEIVSFVEQHYNVSDKKSERAICGLSRGGRHAFLLSMRYPESFSWIGLFSPAVSASIINPQGLKDVFSHAPSLYWIGIGKEDYLYERVNGLCRYLDQHGYDYEYHESDGTHSWFNWRDYLCAFLGRLFKERPIVQVEEGLVGGVSSQGVSVFRGIPYAAPPVGGLRWREPRKHAHWEGVLQADEVPMSSYQTPQPEGSFYWREFYSEGTPPAGEDCLYLNIYAPDASLGKPEAKLPVAFWIHGGAYMGGYGSEITMDTDAWAKRGVILVTINYRLGLLGFLSHPWLTKEQGNLSGNYGFLDQVAALKWVKENIAHFGGDPDNITIFGQSAGALSVKNLLISPLSRGLFSKAIIQSGGGVGKTGLAPDRDTPPDTFDLQGERLMRVAGIQSLRQMRSMPIELLSAKVKASGVDTFGLFAPHLDYKALPKDFDTSVRDGNIAPVPILIGYNSNDMGPLSGACVDTFCQVRDSLGQAPTFAYEFCRDLPGDNEENPSGETAGAFHSSELWYMFHTLDRCWRPFTRADYLLSEEMIRAWTDFCKTASPGWPAYKSDNPYKQIFDIQPRPAYE